MLLSIMTSVLLVSLISLIGVSTFAVNKKFTEKYLLYIIAFAAGTMLAAAFFHLLPEVTRKLENGFAYVLGGIVIFFILEKFIWHHCHTHNHDIKPHTVLNILGDAMHNFVDGTIIAAAFLTDLHLGIVASIAIAVHEVPQEIGDYAILVHGGLARKNALLFNFLSALMAVVGALLTYVVASTVENIVPYFLALAAGSFIYIASTDLLPELHEEKDWKKLIFQTLFFVGGIVVIYFVTTSLGIDVH